MNKKLLSLLFALPLVAMQINAITQVTEVSLGDSDSHAQDTLTLATNDATTIASKLQTLAQLNTELMDLEVQTKDALEKLALQQPFVQKFIEENMAVRKVIIVPNKLINVVVG